MSTPGAHHRSDELELVNQAGTSLSSVAPMAKALVAQPGKLIAPATPLLPAAMSTETPELRSCAIEATTVGETASQAACWAGVKVTSVPMLRLTATRFGFVVSLSANTRCRALLMDEN